MSVAGLGGARLPTPGSGSALLSSSPAQACVRLLPSEFPPRTLRSADLLAAPPSLVTLPGSLLSLLPFLVTLTSTHPGPHLSPVRLESVTRNPGTDVEHLGRSSRVGRERDLPTARPLSSPTSRAPVFLWSPLQVLAPSAEPRVLPSTGPPHGLFQFIRLQPHGAPGPSLPSPSPTAHPHLPPGTSELKTSAEICSRGCHILYREARSGHTQELPPLPPAVPACACPSTSSLLSPLQQQRSVCDPAEPARCSDPCASCSVQTRHTCPSPQAASFFMVKHLKSFFFDLKNHTHSVTVTCSRPAVKEHTGTSFSHLTTI